MVKTREAAHQAMRKLWMEAHEILRTSPDTTTRVVQGVTIKRVVTPLGLTIEKVDDQLSVEAEFDAQDHDETTRVEFPVDIRDLSETDVHTDWSAEHGWGANTPPVRDFPNIAHQLLQLL